jgi:hypothetical protein
MNTKFFFCCVYHCIHLFFFLLGGDHDALCTILGGVCMCVCVCVR